MSGFWSLHTKQAAHVEHRMLWLAIPGLGPPLGIWDGERLANEQNWTHLGNMCSCQEVKGRKVPHASTHIYCALGSQLGLAEDGQDGEEGS